MKLVWFGLVLGSVFLWFKSSLNPVSNSEKPVSFVISSGDPAAKVIQALADQKLVRSYYSARIYHKLNNFVFRPGIYYLNPSLDVSQIFTELAKGPKDIKITFPEGWRREQYATRLKTVFPEFDTDTFLKLTATLEGRLFPDTYYLPASPSPQQVVKIFTSNFVKKTKLDLTNSQTLILASLVERESNNPNDSQIIAGILLKRLAKGWPLQIDATVQYAQDKNNWWHNPIDTKFPSLYNTYLHPGLPPGPIASPGLTSLRAIQNPQKTDYWFYLTSINGITYFAKDLATHQKLIDTYLKP